MNSHRFGVFLVALCLMACSASGQTPQVATQAQSASSQQPPTVTSALKKTVGLIRVGFSQNGTEMKASGTCFFVLYQDKRLGEQGGFIYLVTNRHVAEPGIEDGQPYRVLWTTVRLNQRGPDHKSEDERLPLGPEFRWYFPKDDSVDLAVLPIAPDQTK